MGIIISTSLPTNQSDNNLFMKKPIIKYTFRAKEQKDVELNGVKAQSITRIDEESLFNLFTADIMKMKIKFTR